MNSITALKTESADKLELCIPQNLAVAGAECNTAIELKREQHDACPSPL